MKKPHDVQVCRELTPLALESEGELCFPNLPSQAVPKAARQERVILNNEFETESQQYILDHSRNILNTRWL